MDNVGSEQLRSLVERIERVEGEISELNSDKADIYAEAKSSGFDVTALKAAIGIRRKRSKDPDGYTAKQGLVDLYLEAIAEPSRVHAHEAA